MSKIKNQDGFTLIELSILIAILAISTILLYNGIHSNEISVSIEKPKIENKIEIEKKSSVKEKRL